MIDKSKLDLRTVSSEASILLPLTPPKLKLTGGRDRPSTKSAMQINLQINTQMEMLCVCFYVYIYTHTEMYRICSVYMVKADNDNSSSNTHQGEEYLL